MVPQYYVVNNLLHPTILYEADKRFRAPSSASDRTKCYLICNDTDKVSRIFEYLKLNVKLIKVLSKIWFNKQTLLLHY